LVAIVVKARCPATAKVGVGSCHAGRFVKRGEVVHQATAAVILATGQPHVMFKNGLEMLHKDWLFRLCRKSHMCGVTKLWTV